MKILRLSLTAIYDLIIYEEVSSRKNYEAKLTGAIWPGGHSGVTIGLGYDLAMAPPKEIATLWGSYVDPDTLEKLKKCSGKFGAKAAALVQELQGLFISWETAKQVFYNTSLIKYAKMAAKIYPELEELHPYEQTAIAGLVYNRGNSLSGDRRSEMRSLVAVVRDDNDSLMASYFRQMKRLWKNTNQGGLLRRREKEAVYIELPDKPLPAADILEILI